MPSRTLTINKNIFFLYREWDYLSIPPFLRTLLPYFERCEIIPCKNHDAPLIIFSWFYNGRVALQTDMYKNLSISQQKQPHWLQKRNLQFHSFSPRPTIRQRHTYSRHRSYLWIREPPTALGSFTSLSVDCPQHTLNSFKTNSGNHKFQAEPWKKYGRRNKPHWTIPDYFIVDEEACDTESKDDDSNPCGVKLLRCNLSTHIGTAGKPATWRGSRGEAGWGWGDTP